MIDIPGRDRERQGMCKKKEEKKRRIRFGAKRDARCLAALCVRVWVRHHTHRDTITYRRLLYVVAYATFEVPSEDVSMRNERNVKFGPTIQKKISHYFESCERTPYSRGLTGPYHCGKVEAGPNRAAWS